MINFWLITIFFLATRAGQYFVSYVPTGYDAGIYLDLFKRGLGQVPDWLAGSYHSALFYGLAPVVRWFPDMSVVLIPLQVLSALFLFFALYWSIRSFMVGNQILFTLFLFTISAVQFRMFWFFYVKNMLALGFLLIFLGLIIRHRYWLACVMGILIGVMHLPTFFVFTLVCAVEFIIHPNKWKMALIYMISLLCTLAFNYPVFSIAVTPFIKPFLELNRVVQPLGAGDWGGTFYDLFTSLTLMALYLFLPIVYFFKNKKEFSEFRKTPFFSGLVATSLIILFQLFFYRRFIPAWDLFVIIAAGYSFAQIKSMKYFYGLVTGLFIIMFVVKTGMPLKSVADITELKKLSLPAKSYVLSTSKEDTAWIMGYTDREVIAWNFGAYSQALSDSEWNQFYSTQDAEVFDKLLQKLPSPLYVYVSQKESTRFNILLQSKLLKKLSPQVYSVGK